MTVARNVLVKAFALVVIGASAAGGAPQIPSSELPGRERERFVDPPGARLREPTRPVVSLPGEALPAVRKCKPRAARAKRKSC